MTCTLAELKGRSFDFFKGLLLFEIERRAGDYRHMVDYVDGRAVSELGLFATDHIIAAPEIARVLAAERFVAHFVFVFI